MYERNAIVLERYFEKIFGFNDNDNLKENYKCYCELIENFEKYKISTEAENVATEEFTQVSNEIAKIQKTQERLYNKGAKFEYNRYIIFNNIKEKTDEIEKCLTQVEKDIEKNCEALNDLGKKFITSIIEYNEKKSVMEKCQKENKKAKKIYEKSLEKVLVTFENISEEFINVAQNFVTAENKDVKRELINILNENGKNERNPFDPDVISNTVNVSIEIYRIEMDIYLTALEKTKKILDEIEIESVKLDRHKKFYNDSRAKLDFLFAEKDYLVQFLDNERIAAIYDKKVHRKLMLEACRNLNSDFEQINKLYDIILKEIAGRSTKRIYKENYNKEYLSDLEKAATDVKLESNKVKVNAVALMNLNYWRIEGIRRIYEVFDKDVTEIYGKDLTEFNPIENIQELDVNENDEINFNEKNVTKIENISEQENLKTKSKKKIETDTQIEKQLATESKSCDTYNVLKSSKKALANAIYISLQKHEFANKNSEIIEQEYESEEDGSYYDIDAKIASLDLLEEDADIKKIEIKEEFDINEIEKIEDLEYDEYSDEFEEETEESILDLYFNSQDEATKKRKEYDEKKLDDGIKNKKGSILKRIININSKKKSEA